MNYFSLSHTYFYLAQYLGNQTSNPLQKATPIFLRSSRKKISNIIAPSLFVCSDINLVTELIEDLYWQEQYLPSTFFWWHVFYQFKKKQYLHIIHNRVIDIIIRSRKPDSLESRSGSNVIYLLYVHYNHFCET